MEKPRPNAEATQLTGPIGQCAGGVASGAPQRIRSPKTGTETSSRTASGATCKKSNGQHPPSRGRVDITIKASKIVPRGPRATGLRAIAPISRKDPVAVHADRAVHAVPPASRKGREKHTNRLRGERQVTMDHAEGRRSASPMTRHGLHVWV